MKKVLIRLKLNKSYIIRNALKWFEGVFALWGVLSTLLNYNLSECLPSNMMFICKLFVIALIVLAIYCLCLIGVSIYCFLSEKEIVFTSNSGHSVYVHYGDIYSTKIIGKNYKERRNLVIPVNRCFDTLVDNDLISLRTLHGSLMQTLYNSKNFTQEELDKKINDSLLAQQSKYEILSKEEKPKGNLNRYEVGSIAEVKENENLVYFFLGLSKINEKLCASTTIDEYVTAIQKLVEFCNERSQGFPVVMPILGSGLSRTNIEIQNTVKYIIDVLRINRNIINCDFHIVIKEDEKNKLSIKNL
ncbi:MAG: DUF6430 domain-containing protein [Bacteroidales bacterium]|nr:DUF6430 domain-containing protein [Bacteroidales bacterium]